jgi:hemerythrin-like metal-binding protein
MLIAWKEKYNLGIIIIDEQHRKFVDTINALYESISAGQVKENMPAVFQGLDDYANFHFATEEKYFDEFHYEGAAEHKDKHQEFRGILEVFREQVAEHAVEVSINLLDYLEDWLLDHLITMDKKYVQCFKDHGLN